MVSQAILEFRDQASEIFAHEKDLPQDFGEDVTREALDRLGVSRIDQRLYGKIDYKRARYVFHPQYAVRQALFVDSKAEKTSGAATATLQTAQTSMRIKQNRAGVTRDEKGTLGPILTVTSGASFLTTTIFVKYNYDEVVVPNLAMGAASQRVNRLVSITVAGLPNGLLQDRYNPNATETIWRAGRDAPTLSEAFRVRLVFKLLKQKCRWRVQSIPMHPDPFVWDG